jgi:ParB-like chromosome segregation protein Spo0J
MPALSASSAAATIADIDEWHGEHTLPLPLDAFDDQLQLYRLVQPRLERQMASSLREYGQISPVVVCRLDGRLVLVDGFKRLRAARSLKEFTQLNARLLETDQGAKAAIFQLNRVAGKPVELEEAWIIHALITQDGLKQADVAKLFGRHKSWVNRRFALLQRLCDGALESLRLGLLTPTQARHLTRLPRGNQGAVLAAASKESLTSRELSEVVDLLSDCGTVEQTAAVLAETAATRCERRETPAPRRGIRELVRRPIVSPRISLGCPTASSKCIPGCVPNVAGSCVGAIARRCRQASPNSSGNSSWSWKRWATSIRK